jgi:RNA polymerase sigma factor (sigma-70 family)
METTLDLYNAYKTFGGEENLRNLLKSCYPSIYNTCYQILRHHQDAEDTAQMVLLKVVEDFKKVPSIQHFQRWIYRVAFNLALDLKRKNMRKIQREDLYQINMEVNAAENKAEIMDIIHEHIAQLDDDSQGVMVQHYFEKKTLQEIADEWKVTASAIWQKLQKAQEKLKKSLTKEGFAQVAPLSIGYLESVQLVQPPSEASVCMIVEKICSMSKLVKLKSGGLWLFSKPALVLSASCLVLVMGGVFWISDLKEKSVVSVVKTKSIPGKSLESSIQTARTEAAGLQESQPPISQPRYKIRSSQYLGALCDQVFLIQDSSKRLTAIRNKLGINISDSGYEEFLALERDISDRLESPDGDSDLVKYKAFTIVSYLFGAVLEKWHEEDPAAVKSWIMNIDGWDLLFKNETLRRVENGYFTTNFSSKVERSSITDLASINPSEAVKLIDQIQDEGAKAAHLRSIAPIWAQKNPEVAAEYLVHIPAGLEHGTTRHIWINHIAEAWGKLEPDKALNWVQNLTDERERIQALPLVLIGWVEAHPTKTIELTSFTKEDQRKIVGGMLSHWTIKDAFSAAKYAEQFPDQELKDFSCQVVAANWGRIDPESAANWVLKLPKNALRDKALVELIQTLGIYDISTALSLGKQISNPKILEGEIRTLFFRCEKTNLELLNSATEIISNLSYQEVKSTLRVWPKSHSQTAHAWLTNLEKKGKIEYNLQRGESFQELLKNVEN